MNRQIKFRGIATVNDKYNGIKVGDFVCGCFVDTNIDCQILFGDGEQISVDRKTVGQFTGPLDKNGVELCEGDIVRDHVGVGVVEYNRRRAAFRVNYNDGTAKWFIDYTLKGERYSIEVIGNIHQNQELLK